MFYVFNITHYTLNTNGSVSIYNILSIFCYLVKELKSSGIDAEKVRNLLSLGWKKEILYECNAVLEIKFDTFPYFLSPTIGKPK